MFKKSIRPKISIALACLLGISTMSYQMPSTFASSQEIKSSVSQQAEEEDSKENLELEESEADEERTEGQEELREEVKIQEETEMVEESNVLGETVEELVSDEAEPFVINVNPADGSVEISQWSELVEAISNPSVSIINLSNSIVRPTGNKVGDNPGTLTRDLTINGNGNTIDFGDDTALSSRKNHVLWLGSVSVPTSLTLNEVVLKKSKNAFYGGNGFLAPADSTTGSNWNLVLQNNVRTEVGDIIPILQATSATVTVAGVGNDLNFEGSGYLFDIMNLDVLPSASLNLNCKTTDAVILMNGGYINIQESASLILKNLPASGGTLADGTNTPGRAHGIYGSTSLLNMEANSLLDIDVVNTGYRTMIENTMTMKEGAKFYAKSQVQSAIALCQNYADSTGYKATVSVDGEGTLLDIRTSSKDTAQNGAAMRVQGVNSEFNVTNKAMIYSHADFGTTIQMQGNGSVFTVKDGAEIDLVADSDNGYSLGATLRFRIAGNQTFNVDNGTVRVHKKSGDTPAVRLFGGNNNINVINGGRFEVYNAGNGTASSGATNSGNQGIIYTDGSATKPDGFFLDGAGSTVLIKSDFGPAIRCSTGTDVTINSTPGTVFIATGNTNTSSTTGIFTGNSLNITMNEPLFFDFRNRQVAGGKIFATSSSSTFTMTRSNLSVWLQRSNLDGTPTRSWAIFDYALSGKNFSNIVSTNVPSEFNSTTYLGADSYSRMSGNNAKPIIDELRVPTDADKYIFGHAVVPEGLEGNREAWTDEVYVEVEVDSTDPDTGITTTQTLTGKSIGIAGTDQGYDVYGDGPRGGIIKFNNPGGVYLKDGQKIRVTKAWRGPADSNSERASVSGPEDILTGEVEVQDVTPMAPVNIDGVISTRTKVLSGTGEEPGAAIKVKVNDGVFLQDTSGGDFATVEPDGTWSFTLPNKLATGDKVSIYSIDQAGIATDVIKPPITNSIQGNISPELQTVYHDAVFPAKVNLTVVFGGALSLTAPDFMNYGSQKISSKTQLYKISNMDQKVSVIDDRLTKNEWRLAAKVTQPLQNVEQSSTLEEGFIYYKNGEKLTLGANSVVILQHKSTTDEEMILSDDWYDASGDGLYVEMKGGEARVGSYEGTIQWVLEDVIGNE